LSFQGKYYEAIEKFEEVVKIDSNNSRAYVG
jgi:hypothetical protein